MPNKTEQCIQDNLFAAQADLAPHGISLGLKGIATNAKRVIHRGVITTHTAAISVSVAIISASRTTHTHSRTKKETVSLMKTKRKLRFCFRME